MQYKPGNWVTGFKRSPRAANVQHRDMGLFLNSSGKFEPIDDAWDNLHSGGLFISDDNKLYFRDETNKDIYINSPAAETLGLSAGNATTAGFVTINEEGFDTDFRVEASGEANALFVQGSDGAVGIGTGSPDVELQVVGDLKVGQDTASTLGSDMMIDIVNNTTGQALAIDQTGTLGANTAVIVVYSNTDQDQANSPLFGAHLDNSGSTSPVMSLRQDGTGDVLQVKDGSETISFKIADGGDVTLATGNLVIGTAGKGIDFSAQTSPGAGMTSELLDRYEEGTCSLVVTGVDTTGSATGQLMHYQRVGNTVTINGAITQTPTSAVGQVRITGLPFASVDASGTGTTYLDGAAIATVGTHEVDFTAGKLPFLYVPRASSHMDGLEMTDDGSWTDWAVDTTASQAWFINLSYTV